MSPNAAADFLSHFIKSIPTSERIADAPETTPRGSRVTLFAIRGRQAVGELVAALEAPDDGAWAWQAWLDHALGAGDPIIIIRDLSSRASVGFTSFATDLFGASTRDGVVDLSLELVSVYIRPDCRGKGYGSALRGAATVYARSLVDSVAAIPSDLAEKYGLSSFSMTLTAEPRSHEGAAFSAAVFIELERYLHAAASSGWFGQATLIDRTEPEDVETPRKRPQEIAGAGASSASASASSP